jgi:hypothetical protein
MRTDKVAKFPEEIRIPLWVSSMLYLTLAVLLAGASLMLDIASAWGKGVEAMRTGRPVGGTSLLPGLIFFPSVGCGLFWVIERVFPGYGFWIISIPTTLVIFLAFGFYLRCRYMARSKGSM